MSLRIRLTARQKFFAVLCFVLPAVLLFIPVIQSLLISAGGKILGRTLNHPGVWEKRIQRTGLYLLCVPLLYFFFSLESLFAAAKRKFVSGTIRCAVLLFLAFLTSSLFALFPFKVQYPCSDSAVFISIGRMMHLGRIPYRDIFDHKGIVLYFIEYLGTFAGGYTGVYLIELAGMFATVIFIYKAAALSCRNETVCLLTSFFSVYMLGSRMYEGANLSEEYALPCIAFSSYVFLLYLRTGQCRFFDFFFVGLTFTAVLLLRVNMVAPWAFYVPYFLVILLKDRKYSDLKTMVAGFACGMIVLFIPVMVYFHVTSSFRAMWETYVLFNLMYVSDEGELRNVLGVMRMFVSVFAFPCICQFAAVLQQGKDRYHVINALVFLVTLLSVSVSGRAYPHYGIILLPLCVLPVAYVLEKLRENLSLCAGVTAALVSRFCLSLLILIPLLGLPNPMKPGRIWQDSIVRYLRKETAPDSDVLVLANEAKYYIAAERYTRQRFLFQEPVIRQDSALMREFEEGVRANPPDYIVLSGYHWNWLHMPLLSGIREFLDASYSRVDFPEGIVFRKDRE